MATKFKYAIHRGGKSFGVESVSRLHDMACRRKLAPDDFVFDYVRRTWIRADAILELQPIFAAHREIDSLSSQPQTKRADLSAPELSGSQMNAFIGMTVPRTAQEKAAARSASPPRSPSMTQNRLDLNKLFEDVESEPTLHHGTAYRVTHSREEVRPVLSEKVQQEALRRFSELPPGPVNAGPPPPPPAKAEAGRPRFSRGVSRKIFWATVAVLLVLLVSLTAFRTGAKLYGAGEVVYITQVKGADSLPIRSVGP